MEEINVNKLGKEDILDYASTLVFQTPVGSVKQLKNCGMFIGEFKYAILAAVLFIVFSLFPCDRVVRIVMPSTHSVLIFVYTLILFILLFYLISKMRWFQEL
jgi:hypothetical protein